MYIDDMIKAFPLYLQQEANEFNSWGLILQKNVLSGIKTVIGRETNCFSRKENKMKD